MGVDTKTAKSNPMHDRLARLNECYLNYQEDPSENIISLTALCGELMGAACAFYKSLKRNVSCVWGNCYDPPQPDSQINPDGFCYDIIQSSADEFVVIRDLHETKYAETDPNIIKYNLQTLVGRVVKFGSASVGLLFVAYQRDFMPADDDEKFMGLIAAAIGVEEKRKNSELALQDSEDKFKRVLDCSQDVTYQLNLETGTYDYFSPSVFDIFGYTAEEVIEMTFEGSLKRVHPDDIQLIRQNMADFLASKDHLVTPTLEYRYKHRDGHYIWVSTNRALIRDKNGKPIYIVANVRDVTEQKRTEETLRKKEQMMSAIFKSAAIGISLTHINGDVFLVNPQLKQMLGYSKYELQEMSWFDIIHPDDTGDLKYLYHKLLEHEPPTVLLEKRCICKNGNIIWTRLNVSLIPNTEEEPELLLVLVENITEHKYAQEALRASEKRYRGLVESQRDLLIRVTPEGLFTFVNNAFCKAFGKLEAELLGTHFSPLVYSEDLPHTMAKIEKLNVPPHRCSVEQRALTLDGLRLFSWEVCAILGKEGEIVEIQAIGRDVTERRQAELELQTAYSNLEKSYKLQREFLNNVTHEVRTPLTAVKGYTDMLLEGVMGPINDEQAMLLRKILTSSNHLIEIVTEVLEMARLKSGSISIRAQACKPSKFVEKAVTSVLPQAQQKGLNLTTQQLTKKCMGIYDSDKCAVILINLLSNAVKFTEQGSIDVMVSYSKIGTEVIVADTGCGISESHLNNIFNEFRQLDYPGKHKPVGFGLGLAIVATMVETIGASLTVSSKEGIGTAFTLNIPVLNA